MFRHASMLAIVAAMASWGAEAQAQSNADATVETVTVTARRRAESLQEVPISAAVLEADTIERMALTDARDVITQIPGVKMAAGTVGATVSDDIVIRGVGVARIDGSGGPTGIFRDNMFIGNGTYFGKSFTNFDMFDIKRFEVFKGPQGALWGRQAAGGAVSIISNEPEFNFSAKAKVGYEFEQEAMKAEGVINVPISDTLAIRIGGLYDDRDGGHIVIQDNGSPLNGRALDKTRWAGIRGAIRWAPTDAVDQKLTLEYLETDNPSFAVFFSRPGRGDPSPYTRGCLNQLPTSRFIPGQLCQFNDSNQQSQTEQRQAFYQGKFDLGMGTLQLSGIWTDRSTLVDDEWDTYTHALVGPTVGLATTGALQFGAAITNRGVGASNTSLYTRYGDFKKTGGEVLYTSQLDGPLSFLVGADYYDTTDVANQKNIIQYFNPSTAAGPVPAGALIANHLLNNTNARDGKSWSVFGTIEYDILENVTISIEGRSTHNEFIHTASNQTTISCPAAAPLPLGCTAGQVLTGPVPSILAPTETSEDVFTPVATLAWKIMDGHNVYARYAEGFRPGGFDTRNAGTAFFGKYEAEIVKSAEVGYKGRVLGNHVMYTVAGYFNNHENFQIQDSFVGDDGFVRSKIGNAPEAESWGVEAAARARFEAGGGIATVGIAYAWTDGEIKPYRVATATAGVTVPSGFSGKRLSDTRDYQVNLDAGFEAPFMFLDGATWSTNASVHLEGGGFQNAQNTFRMPNTKQLDLTFGVRKDNWRVALYGRNVTDNVWTVQNIAGAFPEGNLVIYNTPRTWGFDITRTW